MYVAKITITLRKSILDPQGKAVHHALESLQMDSVKEVRIGKYIEIKIEASSKDDARSVTEETCKKLLANLVMEDYTYVIEQISDR